MGLAAGLVESLLVAAVGQGRELLGESKLAAQETTELHMTQQEVVLLWTLVSQLLLEETTALEHAFAATTAPVSA
jgi:hypothetical protein